MNVMMNNECHMLNNNPWYQQSQGKAVLQIVYFHYRQIIEEPIFIENAKEETYTCPPTHSKCANHYCIPLEYVCNHDDDCGDNSDEGNVCAQIDITLEVKNVGVIFKHAQKRTKLTLMIETSFRLFRLKGFEDNLHLEDVFSKVTSDQRALLSLLFSKWTYNIGSKLKEVLVKAVVVTIEDVVRALEVVSARMISSANIFPETIRMFVHFPMFNSRGDGILKSGQENDSYVPGWNIMRDKHVYD